VLSVETLQAAYGAAKVLFDVSFTVGAGEMVTLLGRNGMGKTTTISTIMGLLPAAGGRIVFEETQLDGLPPYRIAQAGLGLVPEGRQIFPTLSVEENIQTGLPDAAREVPSNLYDFFPVLREMRKRRAGNLSGGQQQQVAIARALASRPRVLLLDEPTEGIQPSIIKELAVELKRIRDEKGVTIIVSEQVLSFALAVADRVVVMVRGSVVHESPRRGLDEAALGKLLSI